MCCYGLIINDFVCMLCFYWKTFTNSLIICGEILTNGQNNRRCVSVIQCVQKK